MTKHILFSPFPKQLEFVEAVLSQTYSFVMYGGSIRSGKSYAAIGILVMLCKIYPRSRWAIIRKDSPTLEKNIYPVIEKIIPENFVKADRGKSTKNPHIEFTNGSIIMFFPENFARDKSLERFKGLEVNGWLADEINELQEETFIKMRERSGSYIIPGEDAKQPDPIIIGTCNPSNGWLKDTVYTPWKNNELPEKWHYIRAIVSDNPTLPQAYLDELENLPYYHYRVFVSGDWDFTPKNKNAYWKGFELDKHVHNYPFNPNLPVHLSVDDNVLPYISVSFWQMPDEFTVKQFAEIAAIDPDNSAQNAAKLVNKFLNTIGHEDTVILHGDASTNNKNTIDPEKRSFVKLFEGVLKEEFIVRNRVARSNPSVSLRGEFINAIYAGLIPKLSISINESCKTSINDYISVVEDMNGGMQKRRITKNGLTYEPNGHFSDTKAYFLCDVFRNQFNEFKNAGSTHEYILKVNKSHNSM